MKRTKQNWFKSILVGNLPLKLIEKVKTTSINKFDIARAIPIFIVLLLSVAMVSAGDVVVKAGDLEPEGNITLGQKITFALGEIIDNIVDGWITITGGLNVTGNIETNSNITADYFIGNGSQLTDLPSGGNLSWNETRAGDWLNNNRSKDVRFGDRVYVADDVYASDIVNAPFITADKILHGANITSVNGAKLCKILLDTYEGNGSNNRILNLGNDYDEIEIWPEQTRTSSDYFVRAWAIRTTYGSLRYAYLGHSTQTRIVPEAMAGANPYFQGKMTGADVNKIKLGSSGSTIHGSNYNGWTYRIVAKKYCSVESLPAQG